MQRRNACSRLRVVVSLGRPRRQHHKPGAQHKQPRSSRCRCALLPVAIMRACTACRFGNRVGLVSSDKVASSQAMAVSLDS